MACWFVEVSVPGFREMSIVCGVGVGVGVLLWVGVWGVERALGGF